MKILGISCFYHDSAAALFRGGKLLSAVQEERFSRIKNDASFPTHAVKYCLKANALRITDIDYVAFYEKPLLKFERILQSYFTTAPKGMMSFLQAIPLWLKKRLWIAQTIRKELEYRGETLFIDHHMSHAAGSFLLSPFKNAAIITVDGVGEWTTTAIGYGSGSEIALESEIRFPHSLGLLYTACTYYLGFRVNSDEYKVMGLAPYGKPKYYETFRRELIDIKRDGSFRLNTDYFPYTHSLYMINERFEGLFSHPKRSKNSELNDFHADFAASLQKITEEIIMNLATEAYSRYGSDNLCLSGGVALNCSSNGKLYYKSPFKDFFILPAAGDAGGAVGSAAYVSNTLLKECRSVFQHSYLGPRYSNDNIISLLDSKGIKYQVLSEQSLIDLVAKRISEGMIVGWFAGALEYGPRALGNRSILADPRDPLMKDKVNKSIKFREAFRPFAPVVLEERMSEYFDTEMSSRYMLFTFNVRKEKQGVIPAVTHIDNTSRIQSVTRESNQRLYDLIRAFERITGIPVLLNTSFNIQGEPIVASPNDALTTFTKSGLDLLVLENCVITKGNKC